MTYDIETNVLLNMIKWNIGWKYVDILKMFGGKICKLLSLIIGISLIPLGDKNTFKYIVEKTGFKHKLNFVSVL